MVTHETEVLVVGLGPVGSICALYLARKGIDVAAIEVGAVGSSDLRASTWHAPTIEILDDMGVADVLLAQGLKAPLYQYRDRQGGEVYSFDLGELSDHTRFPYRIQCEQHIVAHDLAARLEREARAMVAFNRRLLFLEQDDDGVTAYIETPLAVERIRARYVIGADGANSIVRKNLDLGFPGYTYSDKFLCLSTEHPLEETIDDLCHVNYVSDPKEWLVLLRVPKLWRILLPADEQISDATLLSDETKDGVFRRLLGSDVSVATKHRTLYRVHQRVCERFAVGRVCLVGDAAHLNSPIGGFGMNSGIHDAINLSDKLIAILRDDADEGLVELYARQRHAVTTAFVQAQTIENAKMMKEGWSSKRDDDIERMSNLSRDPAQRRAFLLKQSMFTSLQEAAAVR